MALPDVHGLGPESNTLQARGSCAGDIHICINYTYIYIYIHVHRYIHMNMYLYTCIADPVWRLPCIQFGDPWKGPNSHMEHFPSPIGHVCAIAGALGMSPLPSIHLKSSCWPHLWNLRRPDTLKCLSNKTMCLWDLVPQPFRESPRNQTCLDIAHRRRLAPIAQKRENMSNCTGWGQHIRSCAKAREHVLNFTRWGRDIF